MLLPVKHFVANNSGSALAIGKICYLASGNSVVIGNNLGNALFPEICVAEV